MATVNLKLGTNNGTVTNQISGVILQPGDVIQFECRWATGYWRT